MDWVTAGVVGGVGLGLYLFKSYWNGGVCLSNERLDGKTVIITGANTGLGKETALDLARRGGRIIMACRDMEKAQSAADEISKTLGGSCDLVLKKLDLASLKSVRQFAEEVIKEEKSIHVLINNAGLMFCPFTLTEDGYESHFAVNHLGHFLLTNLILDKLKESAPSRIINVSSLGHHYGKIEFDNLNSEKSYVTYEAYCRSKLANVYFTQELSERLQGSHVTVNTLHPGAVRTELGRHITWLHNPLLHFLTYSIGWFFTKSPKQGAQTTIYAAVAQELENVSGKYFSDCRESKVSPSAQDKSIQKKLWDVSMEMVGLASEKS